MDHWDEVMKLAQKYGFVAFASGGVAMLATHEVQREQGIFDRVQYACGKAPWTPEVQQGAEK